VKGVEAAKQQISGVVSGRIVSVTDTPLLTSASTPWSGFLLEIHAPHVVKQDVFWGWNKTHVNLVTEGTLGFRVQRAGRQEAYAARAGSALVFPRGFDETRFSLAESDFQLICVELDPFRLEALLGNKIAAIAGLAPQMSIHDPHIAALLSSMVAEVKKDCPAGAIYAQSLSLALAAYLAGKYAGKKPRKSLKQFSDHQARLVLDYIHENLDSEFNLFDLSNLVQLSPRQFFRRFSNTFGTTPHRYVTNERVRQAKEFLLKGQLPVEIATILGFASQSHFNSVFRKVTGMSPGQFRREHR